MGHRPAPRRRDRPRHPDRKGTTDDLGPAEIGLIVLAVMLLFGYRKLPDASRSLGRSLRIFKGELDGPTPEGTGC